MEHEVEGSRPRGRPKKTWKEVVREDCQARKLKKEDAMDRCKWRKMIKEARWFGWVWVGESSFWYRPTRVVPDQRPLNGRWIASCCTDREMLHCCCHVPNKVKIPYTLFIVGWEMSPKLPIPMGDLGPHTVHGSLGLPESTPHTHLSQFRHFSRANRCYQQTHTD